VLIAALGCLGAAVVAAAFGGWSLARPRYGDSLRQVLRAVAPTQLAAAAMLAVAGVVALSVPPQTGLLVVVVCVVGAIATVAAGCWQGAKLVSAGCVGSCATCTLSCR
jgi:hypothetical protein